MKSNQSLVKVPFHFNLIVDVARPPAHHSDQRQSISRNFSLKIRLKSNKSHCLDLSSLSKSWKRNYLETMSLGCKLDSMVCGYTRPLKEQMHPNCITVFNFEQTYIIIMIRTITTCIII